MNDDKLVVFDTTLRDGEQAPGFSMNRQEKLRFAGQLKRLGVDVIEAGFPVSSDGDFESVKAIAEEAQDGWPVICGLARCCEKDIARAWEAVRFAKRPRIHVFVASSKIHMEKKLKRTPEEILELTRTWVTYARKLCDDIEFSPEDASRTDEEFLTEVVKTAIESGATTINIPDTVGYAVPEEFGKLIQYLYEKVPFIDSATISVHCHNDLNLATANTLQAVSYGARQIEVTINGIGERAGNAALEEVVMALKTRKDYFGNWYEIGVDTTQLGPTSHLLSHLTGIKVQPNKAIVGANAFAHEAGIHQDGVLKARETYEIMTPESVGWKGESIVIAKHSGKHAIAKKLDEMGYHFETAQIQIIYTRVMALADQKKKIYEEDLAAIADEVLGKEEDAFVLDDVKIITGLKIEPTAIVRLHINGELREATGHGNGPVDAAYKAIEALVGVDTAVLEVYDLTSATKGTDAVANVLVQIRKDDIIIKGRGYHTDVITASINAYLQALNRLMRRIKNNHSKKE